MRTASWRQTGLKRPKMIPSSKDTLEWKKLEHTLLSTWVLGDGGWEETQS